MNSPEELLVAEEAGKRPPDDVPGLGLGVITGLVTMDLIGGNLPLLLGFFALTALLLTAGALLMRGF